MYVRAFIDGNADGHGDCARTKKLDHSNPAWLCLVMPLTLLLEWDDGYDISDITTSIPYAVETLVFPLRATANIRVISLFKHLRQHPGPSGGPIVIPLRDY